MEMVGGGEKGHHFWAGVSKLRHCSMRPPTCPRGGGTPLPAAGRWGAKHVNERHTGPSAASHANRKCEIFRPASPLLPNHREHESSRQISSLKALKGKSSWSLALASTPCSCRTSWCVQVVQTVWGGLRLQQREQVPQEHCVCSPYPACILCLIPPEAHRGGCSILTHPSGSHETHHLVSPVQLGKGATVIPLRPSRPLCHPEPCNDTRWRSKQPLSPCPSHVRSMQ